MRSPVSIPTLSAPNFCENSMYFELVRALRGVVYHAAFLLLQQTSDLLACDPGFSAAGRGSHENVFVLDRFESLELEIVRLELRLVSERRFL